MLFINLFSLIGDVACCKYMYILRKLIFFNIIKYCRSIIKKYFCLEDDFQSKYFLFKKKKQI